ncbi:hypothetical protein D1872_324450 [compost metagenome]
MEEFLIGSLGLKRTSKLRFLREISGEIVRVTGILVNSDGSYSFNTLDDVEEINLIEIDVPAKLNQDITDAIIEIAETIANKFSWVIDLRE